MVRTTTKTFVRTLAVTVAAALAMLTVASSADAPNPFVGTWVLNIAKSTFDPPPPLKSHHLTITAVSGGGLRNVINIVEADGTKTHLEFTTALDGKAAPVMGYFADSVIVTKVNENTLKEVFQIAGKPVETGTFTVTQSGKTMSGPIAGTDGKVTWKFDYVFDRQ
jgi:hypothetical protein